MKPNKLKLIEKSFSRNLDNNLSFEENPHIGLCVSGGPDSMALVILMNNWIKKNNGKITIFHFNHGLRQQSEIESKFVKKLVKLLTQYVPPQIFQLDVSGQK